ncbi:pleckstrin homology-like domain-containing protein [Megalops cyprinoides]|uniref:pleckstrin homology-like domain-containing protein n=1 Tax=Megalops cyprinoides TaxID=118141 RepID=UPI0018641BC0|nr:pleckstrin homology-like domain-containing protein [Megalops cyprinoides]
MDEVSATSNGALENTSETVESKTGWLSKRTHFTYRWKPAWFKLGETKLLYGDKEEETRKSIDLVGAKVDVMDGDGVFGWTVTPKDGKRTFCLRAGSELERQDWMLAICQAQLRARAQPSNACVLQ